MWDIIERARRRLRGDEPSPGETSASPAAGSGNEARTDLTFALGRAELERLIGALADGNAVDARPDTPARLEAALSHALEMAGGSGRPAVTRRPAGLYTPETWHIEIADADGRTQAVVDGAIRGGGSL